MAASELKPRIRGYLPCRLATNRENKRGEVLVYFADGVARWFPAEKVDRT